MSLHQIDHTLRSATDDLDVRRLVRQSFTIMERGTLADFEAVVHPEAVNREARDEPVDCRGEGPAAFLATARWLHSAFADLTWDVHEVVVDGDLGVAHVTMRGRQHGPFVVYGDDGLPREAFPSRGRTLAVQQTHWFRIADGLVVEHWANRDDIGQAVQLGWLPPSPAFLVRMKRALRRARRTTRR